MDNSELKERNFEADIEAWLTTKGGYVKGNQATYDKERAIDMDTLIEFLRTTQKKQWELYEKKYGAQTRDHFYQVLQNRIHARGLIAVLRDKVEDLGFKFKLVYFEPPTDLNEDLTLKYQQNILTCTRQFAYSTQNHNTIDMVLSLNGIPVVAIELKNQLTGQSIDNSREQWMYNRDQREELFQFNHRILAYFGIDLYEAIMATELRGDKTRFVPFNQGSNGAGNVGGAGNPPAEDGKYVTSYIWEKVLCRKMLLRILQKYVSRQEETKISLRKDPSGKIITDKEKSVKLIFPRYHQLDCVEKLVADTRQNGAGHNYLIQHSAGSGKSNSIAWLTYALSTLHDEDRKEVFSGVLVITDRRVLNSQLQETILSFDHKDGVVETITDKDPSSKLSDFINDGNTRIMVCTLHRFPQIYKLVTKRTDKRYAIIVDEAHSSQSGKAAEKMKAALADTDEALREMAIMEGKTEEELEAKRDAIMETLLAQGQHPNLSFYAFTATPKPKTLQTFGVCVNDPAKPDESHYVAFHNYSMLQAIEEDFIKDVLRQYTPFTVRYEIAKAIQDDPQYEETPATKAVKAFHDCHQDVVDAKCKVIVEEFRKVTIPAMQGQAKAMVVTASRAHALRYYKAIKAYCDEQGYEDVHPLVAYSGKVKYMGEEYTESQLNSENGIRITEARLPLFFASDMFNMLVVADKYQTGFDEPLLHTMFVDKKLHDVKAVQTLSRLNRSIPIKDSTYILDFVNDPDDIKKSFEPFYTGTELIKPMDLNSVYTYRDNVRDYNLWNVSDEQRVEKMISEAKPGDKTLLPRLSNALKGITDRISQLDEDTYFVFRSKLKSFVRFYNYLAQVERTYDRELYSCYVFCELLHKLLKPKQHQRVNLQQQLKLINPTIVAGKTRQIELEKGKGNVRAQAPGTGGPDDKTDLLSHIIDKVNQMYEGKISKEDVIVVQYIYDKLNQPKVQRKLSKQAKNNDPRQFAESIFPEIFRSAADDCYVEMQDTFTKLFQNQEKFNAIMSQMGEMMYANFRAQDEAVYNPVRFKERVLPVMQQEFADIQQEISPFPVVADYLVDVIAARTSDALDGSNDVLQNAFNRLYCSQRKVALIDKKSHFRSLVSLFEVYLKKMYFIENGKEMVVTRENARPGEMPSLSDCIFQTPCLKRLRHEPDSNKYKMYLTKLKEWRNEHSHQAPLASEQEYDAAISIVTTLYLYVTANNIKWLRPKLTPKTIAMQPELPEYGMAAESKDQ